MLSTFDRPKNHVPVLEALGIPAEKLLTLQPPRPDGSRTTNGGPAPVRPQADSR